MAKTIKFNLILDGEPIRTIEDLKKNFSIEDILEVYNNRLLHKWLEVRGYSDSLEKVNLIKFDTNIEIIKKLIEIFEIEFDDSKVEESIAILNYTSEREVLLEYYNKLNYKTKAVIDDYHAGYDSIIIDIIENKDNMPKIKANIKEIADNYMGLFNLNHRELYNTLISNAPLAVFAILMNNKMREYFISSENSSENTVLINRNIKEFVEKESILKEKLGKELRVFGGDTEAYWKDIEPQNKRFMIISMKNGNYVRNASKFGEELSSFDVNNNFVILNGIDYKSNNSYHELLYMEV